MKQKWNWFKNKGSFLIGMALMITSYMPQIWKTYSTQNVEGQSLAFWVMLVVSLSLIGLNQIGLVEEMEAGKRSYKGVIFQLSNAFLAFVQLFGVVLFR